MKYLNLKYLFFIIPILIISCSYDKDTESNKVDYYKQLQEQLILAEKGDTIFLPSGIIELDRPLSLESVSDITVIGKGIFLLIISPIKKENTNEITKIFNGLKRTSALSFILY